MAIKSPNVEGFIDPGNPVRAPEVSNQKAKSIGLLGKFLQQGFVDVQEMRFKSELDKNEAEFRQELAAELETTFGLDEHGNPVELGQDELENLVVNTLNVSSEQFHSAPPDVQEFLVLQARNELAAKQGRISATELKIRQEQALRKAIANNPGLTTNFLQIARHAGGFSVVSQDIEATLKLLDTAKTTQKETLELIRNKAVEKGVDASLLIRNPVAFWNKAFEVLDAEQRWADLNRDFEIWNVQREMDQQGYIDKTMARLREEQPLFTQQIINKVLKPAILHAFQIDSLDEVRMAVESGAYNLDQIAAELQIAFEQQVAAAKAKWDKRGLIPTETWNEIFEPARNVMEIFKDFHNYDSLQKRLDAMLKIQENRFIQSLPSGAAGLKAADVLTTYVERAGAIVLGPAQQQTVRSVGAAIARAFGATVGGNAPLITPSGEIDWNEAATGPSVGSIIASGSGVNPANAPGGSARYDPAIQTAYREAINSLEQNITQVMSSDNPEERKAAAQAASIFLYQFSNDLLSQFDRQAMRDNPQVTEALLSLSANPAFGTLLRDGIKNGYMKPSDLNVVIAPYIDANKAYLEDLVTGVASKELLPLLKKTTAGTVITEEQTKGLPKRAVKSLDKTKLKLQTIQSFSADKVIELNIDPRTGDARFIFSKDLKLDDIKDRLSGTLNELNAKVAPSITKYVKGVLNLSVTTDDPKTAISTAAGYLASELNRKNHGYLVVKVRPLEQAVNLE